MFLLIHRRQQSLPNQFHANERMFQMSVLNKPDIGTYSTDNMLINSIQIHHINGRISKVEIPRERKQLQFTHVDYILNINAAEARLSLWDGFYIKVEFHMFGEPK
ncbi:hypothetical protein WDU94_010454 [Cyamophila willieti]